MSCRNNPRAIACVLFVLLTLPGCGGYGDVSPSTYEYAKALFSITNRKLEEKLDPVSEQIAAARDEGKLSESEADWLEDIISDARAGDWESAHQAARQMMEEQVKR